MKVPGPTFTVTDVKNLRELALKVWLTSGILPGGARTFLGVIEGGAKYFFTILEGGGRMIFLLIIIITIICILSKIREFFSCHFFALCALFYLFVIIFLLILVKFQNFNKHVRITTVLLKLHL